MSNKDRLKDISKDLQALSSIIKRTKETGQRLQDENKAHLDLLFPDLLNKVSNAAKNLDIASIKEQLKMLKEKQEKDLLDKIKNEK